MDTKDYHEALKQYPIKYESKDYENLKSINEKDVWIDEVLIGDEILETISDVVDDEFMDEIDVIFDLLDIDLPEGLDDMIPYVGELVLGLKLLSEIGKEQRQLKMASKDMKVRVALAKTIAVISKYGAKKVVANVAEFVGKSVASPLGPLAPWVGLVASIGGIKATSKYFDDLEPHLASWIKTLLDLDEDDIFYYKNKSNLDQMGEKYQKNTSQYISVLSNSYPMMGKTLVQKQIGDGNEVTKD